MCHATLYGMHASTDMQSYMSNALVLLLVFVLLLLMLLLLKLELELVLVLVLVLTFCLEEVKGGE